MSHVMLYILGSCTTQAEAGVLRKNAECTTVAFESLRFLAAIFMI
jgi:hypothetical protein